MTKNDSLEWKLKAQKEINEPSDPSLAIEELRSLVTGVDNLKSRMDDAFLIKFLRARKFCVKKAFKLIKNYYQAKESYSSLFYSTTGPLINNAFVNTGAVFMLPNRDQYGCEVYVFRIENILPGFVVEDVFKLNLMMLEVVSEDPDTQIAGIVIIADFTGFEWQKHYNFLSFYYAKKTAKVVQENFPMRFRGFHFINEPLYLYTMFTIIKPFLKDKIKQRVYFHGNNFNSLHKYLNPNILPKCFNGTLECDSNTWIEYFLNKEHYFEEMKHYGYNK